MASGSSHSLLMNAGRSAVAGNLGWGYVRLQSKMVVAGSNAGDLVNVGVKANDESGSSSSRRVSSKTQCSFLHGPAAVVLDVSFPCFHPRQCCIHHHHQRCIHTASSVHSRTSRTLHFPSRAARTKLMSSEGARDFVDSLNSHQRGHLQAALKELQEEGEVGSKSGDVDGVKEGGSKVEVAPPTWLQLRLLCYQQALPFLGFGFLDNFVMITVGEYIDLTIGAALTISTMAAAGLGNLISDLAGLGLADRVEALCRMIGIPNPRLSSAQLHYRSSRWMGLLGRCLGISVGCLLGMIPLLWFDHQHKHEEEEPLPPNNS